MDPNTAQHINNIIEDASDITIKIQKYYDSDEFRLNENSIVNQKLRECFYIHGWDRINKKFYRPFDEGKLIGDLQKIMEKYATKV